MYRGFLLHKKKSSVLGFLNPVSLSVDSSHAQSWTATVRYATMSDQNQQGQTLALRSIRTRLAMKILSRNEPRRPRSSRRPQTLPAVAVALVVGLSPVCRSTGETATSNPKSTYQKPATPFRSISSTHYNESEGVQECDLETYLHAAQASAMRSVLEAAVGLLKS